MNLKHVVVGGLSATVVSIAVPLYVNSEGMKLTPYRDPVGIWTDCAGHTGPDVVPGKVNTPAECEAKLIADFAKHYGGMRACAPRIAEAPPHVQAAALSFTLNVGVGNFCGSTMARKVQAADYAAACAELPRWTMAKGRDCRAPEHRKTCGGIVTRRERERAVCEGRVPSLGVQG